MLEQLSHIQVERYYSKGILIDTNLLLLIIIGLYRRDIIPKCNITSKYTVEDFNQLIYFVEHFKKIITTPNILTEANNLINSANNCDRVELMNIFNSFINNQIIEIIEEYTPSKDLTNLKMFNVLGITDCGMEATIQNKEYLVITDDAGCHINLLRNSVDSINFSHIKSMNLF